MKDMFKNFQFGKADGVKISHLGMAIENKNGTMVSYDPVAGEIVDVDTLNFDGSDLIMKIPVATNAIVSGDLILHNGTPMFVVEIGEKCINVIDIVDGEIKAILPTKSPFGFNFITKYVSMFDMTQTDANETNPFGNMLPLLMMSQGDNTMETMMMMSMMNGGNMTNMLGGNNMMMYMMMSMLGDKKGGSNDNSNFMKMLPLMMMGQTNQRITTSVSTKNSNSRTTLTSSSTMKSPSQKKKSTQKKSVTPKLDAVREIIQPDQ